jgi:hypothetical protein
MERPPSRSTCRPTLPVAILTPFLTPVAVLLLSLSAVWLLRRSSALRNRFPAGPLNLLASPLRGLCAWHGWTALLQRTSLLVCSRLCPLRRCRHWLNGLLLVVLAHYGVTRLIAIVLAAKLPLLLGRGIPVPKILPLV